MSLHPEITDETRVDRLYLPAASPAPVRQIHLARPASMQDLRGQLSIAQRAWLDALGYKAAARKHALLPGPDGDLAGVILGLGDLPERPGAEPGPVLVGLLPAILPHGDYEIASEIADPMLAAVAWGLGAYRMRRYKSNGGEPLPRLKLPRSVDEASVKAIVSAVTFGRDLINTPANDMGPDEIEAAARTIAARHGANVRVVSGEALLVENFPLIHAVGRASPRAPRLIDLTAGRADAPKVTIVGKGIVFDTGGLDIKPSSAMLLMKKDMGGAATALALAHMILAHRLDVRLRVLLPVAENSVDGHAFRPGDIITSRAGKSVEIGNTDAEGRLVLADALALADEEAPDYLFTFATLTGAARVALGPDLPPFFTDDDALADAIAKAGVAVWDPVWRLPLSTPYEPWLDSGLADMNNVGEGGFAGAIVGAMFLKRFVTKARRFAHFDIYGWRPQPKPLGPKGGETNAARATFEMLKRQLGT
jgi:leucyl aminopeptidase